MRSLTFFPSSARVGGAYCLYDKYVLYGKFLYDKYVLYGFFMYDLYCLYGKICSISAAKSYGEKWIRVTRLQSITCRQFFAKPLIPMGGAIKKLR